MSNLLTLPKHIAIRFRHSMLRSSQDVVPGLGRLVGLDDGRELSMASRRRADRVDIPLPRPPSPEEIPPMPTLGARRRPRGQGGLPVDLRETQELQAAAAVADAPSRPAEALNIYNDFFGLTSQPFALTPDPDFLFWSAAHRRAYAMLEYGVMTHAPITLITGEVGAGKTTLLQQLLRNIGSEVTVGLISNPSGSRADLLRWVLMALDEQASPDETYVDLFSRFQSCVIREYAMGRRVILIFDEAQNLDREALEELRMFTNINTGKDVLLQLVLVGQPELRAVVGRKDMRQFAQRVAALFALPAMDLPTAQEYILHRLKVAGRTRKLFANDAVELIHHLTGGVPRLINRLCDLALIYAFTAGRKMVDVTTLHEVLDDGAFLSMMDDTEGDET